MTKAEQRFSDRAVGRFLASALCAAAFSLCLAGCGTWQAPAGFDDAGLRARAMTASSQDVHVAAAVLSGEDSRRMFGANLGQLGVQPVWVEIRNRTPESLWLLRPGTDPDYFSPLEVAWSMHSALSGEMNARIDSHFDRLAFQNPILPGETRAGVLFVNPERLTRLLNLDLLQTKRLIPFTLFLPVPDEPGVPRAETISFSDSDAGSTDYTDLSALRASLERLPCCASDARGTAPGDPLNAVIVGKLSDIGAALVRRGYRRDPQPFDASQHVFGREPDVVLRKIAQTGAPSTWLRIWLAPIRFDGQQVFLVQVGRPVGGRFAPRGVADRVLHEDVDEARNLLVQDVMYSGGLDKLGFAAGVGSASSTEPRVTFSGARIHTDGLRAVLFFAVRPRSLSDVEILEWAPALVVHGSGARDGKE
jgi:hypothetical protein